MLNRRYNSSTAGSVQPHSITTPRKDRKSVHRRTTDTHAANQIIHNGMQEGAVRDEEADDRRAQGHPESLRAWDLANWFHRVLASDDQTPALRIRPWQTKKPLKNARYSDLGPPLTARDQVMDFISSNVKKKDLGVYSLVRPHGLRGYIFMEAKDRQTAEQAAQNVPYARGILPNKIEYEEIEHMLEMVKREVAIQKNDIVEIISGPFKREKAKVTRIDKTKEEVVVELLEAAVPIPITVKMDSVKVVRRDTEDESGASTASEEE